MYNFSRTAILSQFSFGALIDEQEIIRERKYSINRKYGKIMLQWIAEGESIYTSPLLPFTSGPRKIEPGPTYKMNIITTLSFKWLQKGKKEHNTSFDNILNTEHSIQVIIN